MELSILFQKDLVAQRNKLVRLNELNSPQILKDKQLALIECLYTAKES